MSYWPCPFAVQTENLFKIACNGIVGGESFATTGKVFFSISCERIEDFSILLAGSIRHLRW